MYRLGSLAAREVTQGRRRGGASPLEREKSSHNPFFTPPALCAGRFGPFSAVLGLIRGGAPQPHCCRYSLFLLALTLTLKKWALAYRAAVHKWYGTNRGRAGGVNEEAGVGI